TMVSSTATTSLVRELPGLRWIGMVQELGCAMREAGIFGPALSIFPKGEGGEMNRWAVVLLMTTAMTVGCTNKLGSDSPKLDSTGAGSSGSEGYQRDNKDTPAATPKNFNQGTGMNTGDGKSEQPDKDTSVPAGVKPGHPQ